MYYDLLVVEVCSWNKNHTICVENLYSDIPNVTNVECFRFLFFFLNKKVFKELSLNFM